MSKDQQLFDGDKLDPELAKQADRYLEVLKEKTAAVDRQKQQSRLFMKRLRDAGKTKIRHGNTVIEIVSTPASEKIKVKETKQAPVKKVRANHGPSIP